MNYNNLLLFIWLLFASISSLLGIRPHIILITVDDLGVNDVGFLGNSEIFTPNIDALAYSGVILKNYYVYPFPKQSVAALMTGIYPTHIDSDSLDTVTMLPEYLKEMGYATHAVGKWHFVKDEYLSPLEIGYDSYTAGYNKLHPSRNQIDELAKESLKIIRQHDIDKPLFLSVAMKKLTKLVTAMGSPTLDKYAFYNRVEGTRLFHAVLMHHIDKLVSTIVQALKSRNMFGHNSIIIFTNTNGAPVYEPSYAERFGIISSSNYPLKGGRNTTWEGGIMGVGFIWSSLIREPSKISNPLLMSIVDWLPTILDACCANSGKLATQDGISMWESLFFNEMLRRDTLVHHFDGSNGVVTRIPWKLITTGSNQGPVNERSIKPWISGRYHSYESEINLVLNSPTFKALKKVGQVPSATKMLELRKAVTIDCNHNGSVFTICDPMKAPCLFNINKDPCEYQNVADQNPSIVKSLKEVLRSYTDTAVTTGAIMIDREVDWVPPTPIHPKILKRLQEKMETRFTEL